MRHRSPLVHIALAIATLVAGACAQLENLPRLKDEDLEHRLAQSSIVFDMDGNLITTLHGPENRTLVNSLERVPDELEQAVIAIEDERFYEHTGVDWKAIARAALTNAAAGEIKEGGSTITQQYVKNVIIAPGETAERTLERKLNEAALARQLEKRWSKQEILLNYLNTVYFGEGAYGVQAAAKTYFGVPVWKLKLHQSALLAGLIRAPSDYDPYIDREAAKGRRNIVLAKMAELEFITTDEASLAQAKGVNLQKVASKDRYPAPYFLDYVQRLIKYDDRFEKIGKTPSQREQAMFQGGLRIHTTIDIAAQQAAEDAIYGASGALPYESDPYASLVAIDPTNGEVRAMVGGRDWFARPKDDPFAKLNLAILAEPGLGSAKDDNKAAGTGRQGGSSFKAFVLAAAIENGISLAKVYKAPGCMDIPGADNGGPWHVCNYEGSDFGNQLTVLEGTVNSVNTVYAQLIDEIGPEKVVEVAERMGINTDIFPSHSAALGSSPVNPLGMASGYQTLANNGEHIPPVAITKITDATGKVLYEDKTKPDKALDPAVAYLTTSALTQVIQRGTGTRATLGRPAAGKTGTAQEYRDAWFVGYTPNLVAAVWVGYPEGEIEMKPSCSGSVFPCRVTRTLTGSGVTGGSFPALIWQTFMLRAVDALDLTADAFPISAIDLVTVTIDERCGLLANRFTPDEHKVQALLPKSAVPKKSCRVKGDAVEVPDVFGFPVKDAIRVLEDAGFEVEQVEEESNTYPPGRVVGQDPEPGSKAPKGSTVVIAVSVKDDGQSETATVPDVLGMTRAEAEQTLEDAGFEVEVIIQSESGEGGQGRKGRVWKQSPPGGTEAEKGSRVTIWVNPD